MMKIIIKVLLILAIGTAYGQTSFRKSSLSSGGGSTAAGNTVMVYALGELGVQEADQGTTHLSEGFVGPDIAIIMGIEDFATLEGIRLYPNPVKTDLFLHVNDYGSYEVHIFNLTGKEVFSTEWEGTEMQVSMRNFKPAVYLVYIVDREHKRAASFKVEKI